MYYDDIALTSSFENIVKKVKFNLSCKLIVCQVNIFN